MTGKETESWHCSHCGTKLEHLHEVLCDLAGKTTKALAAICQRCKRAVIVGLTVVITLLGPIVEAGPREDRLEAPREAWGKFEVTSNVTATAMNTALTGPLLRVFEEGISPDSIKVINIDPS